MRAVLCAVIFFLCAALATSACGDDFAALFRSYGVANDPQAMTVGDLNGDGYIDAATVHGNDRMIRVLFGNEDGSFGLHATLPTTSRSNIISSADLDSDGDDDLLVAERFKLTATGRTWIGVFLSNGDNTFTEAERVETGGEIADIATVDLDEDGNLDILATNARASVLTILSGNGNGSFGNRREVPVSFPYAIAVLDFDSDGQDDVAVSSHTGFSDPATVSIFKGAGDGTLTLVDKLIVGGIQPIDIAVADFTSDGIPDLVVAGVVSGLNPWFGDGTGSFSEGQRLNIRGAPYGVEAVDVDEDGNVDLVTPGEHYQLNVYWGRGGGAFEINPTFFQSQKGPEEVISADVNRDGHIDLLSMNNDNFVVVVLGTGSRAQGSTRYRQIDESPDRLRLRVQLADIDEDGLLDIFGVVPFGTSGEIWIYLAEAPGVFGNPRRVDAPAEVRVVSAGHLDGDEHLDMVMTHKDGDQVSVLLGTGDGQFQHGATYDVGLPPGPIIVTDLNQDGAADIVTGSQIGNTLFLLYGRGDGSFDPAVSLTTAAEPVAIAVGDFNVDHLPDLAVLFTEDRQLALFLNNGDGSFATTSIDVAEDTRRVVVADVNADLQPDVVVASAFRSDVYLGDGMGGLSQAGDSKIVGRIAVADVDDDGCPDYVGMIRYHNVIAVSRGDCAGNFAIPERYGTGLLPNSVAVGDITQDGQLDLVAGNDMGIAIMPNLLDLPTPTRLAFTLVEASPKLVRIQWYISDGPSTVRLERAEREGEWSILMANVYARGGFEYLDHDVLPGHSYIYRLAESDGHEDVFSEPAKIQVPEGYELLIDRVRLGSSGVVVNLTLLDAAPATIELVDVAGRTVSSRRTDASRAGAQQILLMPPTTLPSGIYLVVLRQGDRSTSRKVALYR